MAHGEAGGSEDADARCSNVGRQFYATTVNCAGLIWLMDGVEHGLVDGHSVAVCSHRRSRPQLRQDKISAPNIRVFHFFRSVPDVGGHCAIRIGNRRANPSSNLPRLFTIAVDQLFEARFTNISTSISDQDRALVVVAQLQPLRALSSVRRASFIHAAPREEREREISAPMRPRRRQLSSMASPTNPCPCLSRISALAARSCNRNRPQSAASTLTNSLSDSQVL